jgi:hypothetical protein
MQLTVAALFNTHFAPLYDQGTGPALRPQLTDMLAPPASWSALLPRLSDLAAAFANAAPVALHAPTLQLDFSDASVHHLAAALTRVRRDALLAQGATSVRKRESGHEQEVQIVPSALAQFVLHGAVYVGECIVRTHGEAPHRASWKPTNPLWESRVTLNSAWGTAELSPFDWLLKSLTDEEIDEPRLADRYRTHVEVPCTRTSALPVFLRAKDSLPRPLPRLNSPSYDMLVKYLRAHLPELRDLGADFPTAERWAELHLQHLEFHVLGEGRMVLLVGPKALGQGDPGLHAFWLGAAGFEKALFIPTDLAPSAAVTLSDALIQFKFHRGGTARNYEVPWWGP